MIRLVDRERIDLTVVGPEAPLGRGLADRFEAEGRRVFGPTQGAAQLETSKAFAKDFMQRHGVPTAHYRVCTSADEAIAAIRSRRVRRRAGRQGRWPRRRQRRGRRCRSRDGRSRGRGRDDRQELRRRRLARRARGAADRARSVVLRGRQRRALRAAPVRAGSQAHLRRRPGPEYRRHGRVLAEPVDERRAAVADRDDDRRSRC